MSIQDEVRDLVADACMARGTLMPPGAGIEEVAALEHRLGVVLPADLREWLLMCNAPDVGPGGVMGISPAGPGRDLEATLHLFRIERWLENGWLPLATDGCGSYYILATHLHSTAGHPVLFIDEYDFARPAYIVASGLWPFLRFLLKGEEHLDQAVAQGMLDESLEVQESKYQDLLYWPFSKERVLQEDPGLAEDIGVPQPWEVS